VRYCLTGRVVRAIGRMRVIVRLVDVEEDRHLWGDSFDGDARDALTLQDLVVSGVFRDVYPRILGEQIKRARHVDPAALTGFDLACGRSLSRCHQTVPDRSTVPNAPLTCLIGR
jgi:hypothetical protein